MLLGADASAFAWAVSKGFISGYTNGMLGPDSALTRAQFASILYRVAGIE